MKKTQHERYGLKLIFFSVQKNLRDNARAQG